MSVATDVQVFQAPPRVQAYIWQIPSTALPSLDEVRDDIAKRTRGDWTIVETRTQVFWLIVVTMFRDTGFQPRLCMLLNEADGKLHDNPPASVVYNLLLPHLSRFGLYASHLDSKFFLTLGFVTEFNFWSSIWYGGRRNLGFENAESILGWTLCGTDCFIWSHEAYWSL
jgi:hypothetical protein